MQWFNSIQCCSLSVFALSDFILCVARMVWIVVMPSECR